MTEEDTLLAFHHECGVWLTTHMPEDGGDNPTVKQSSAALRIEEALKVHNSGKPKGNNVAGPSVVNRAVVRLPDPKLKTLGERAIECIFVGYAKHSNAFRFSSVLRPSLRIPNGTEYIGGSSVPEEVTEEVVQQPEPELRKNKRNRTPKNFGPGYQLYLIEGTRDEVSDQHSYFFNVEDDPKTFDEAMKKLKVDETIEKFKARLVIQGFKQKSRIDYFDTYAPVACISIIRLLIAMSSIHNMIIHHMDVKTDFLNGELEVEVHMNQHQGFIMLGNENKEFLSSRFSMKDIGKADVILDVSQLEYSRVIGWLMYVMTYTSPDIAFAVGKLSRYTSNPGTQHWQAIQRVLKYLKKTMNYRLTFTGYPLVLEGYTDARWIRNTEDNSSTSGWVFLLGGGAISWASKKQTCITGSIIESKFVTLAAADKEAEWLKNLLIEIPLWVIPIAPTYIHCDSVATLAKVIARCTMGNLDT
nr:zinc finger, CCHC-type [Tanacetum cinerariifolium]